MKLAGISFESSPILESAGWMRLCSASKTGSPSLVSDHQLAVDHVAALGEAQLGEVARQRLAPPRLDVGVVAVDEDDRPESVELRLVGPLLAER